MIAVVIMGLHLLKRDYICYNGIAVVIMGLQLLKCDCKKQFKSIKLLLTNSTNHHSVTFTVQVPSLTIVLYRTNTLLN